MMDFLLDEIIQVTLSQEELAYLVRLSGATHLPGLRHDAATILNVESGDSLARAAERALLARGWLQVQGDRKLGVGPSLHSLIQLCIKPAYLASIAIAEQELSYSELHIFNVAPNITVLHEIPLAGIHQFTGVTHQVFDLGEKVLAFLPLANVASRRILLQIFSLLQAPPVTNQYTIWSAGGEYWFSETAAGEDDADPAQKRGVTREELIVQLERIGEPIRAVSTLSIEPQP